MNRRELIALLGGTAAAWPLSARAQPPAVPARLTSRGPANSPEFLAAIRQGLKDAGFVEGQNVTIKYRFAGYRNDRLSALAADLVA